MNQLIQLCPYKEAMQILLTASTGQMPLKGGLTEAPNLAHTLGMYFFTYSQSLP